MFQYLKKICFIEDDDKIEFDNYLNQISVQGNALYSRYISIVKKNYKFKGK